MLLKNKVRAVKNTPLFLEYTSDFLQKHYYFCNASTACKFSLQKGYSYERNFIQKGRNRKES